MRRVRGHDQFHQQAEPTIMDLPSEVLKCSSCELPASKNTKYEVTEKKFPCKYQEFGCRVTVPYLDQGEVIAHEEVCKHRRYVCPVLDSSRCDWRGTTAEMLAHCRDQHPDSVLENPCSFTHDITQPSLHNYIISAFHLQFLLHTKVCVVPGKLFHAVRLLGAAVDAAEYFFQLDIKRNNELVTKKGQVAPQGCLTIQDDTLLILDTNNLDDATFTVTVKRRNKCVECGKEVTVFLNCDGWRCESCGPARRACENQSKGCTHIDIGSKCSTHERYFCQHGTKCYICNARLSPGSLSAHYASEHQDITHMSGSTWRATQVSPGWQRCLVSSVAGTAVCLSWLDGLQYVLYVCSSLLSERLSEFRCKVRVTDPASGHARTFIPDTWYDLQCDWDVGIFKTDFPSWNTELDVCVEISKIESS